MEGRQLSQFRIEYLLGRGAFTETYRAVDTVRRRPAALKLLRLDEEQDLPNIVQQARLASDLVHPHLAWVWDAGEADGEYFIAERFVDGASLAEMIAAVGPIPWQEALEIIQHIAQGLDFAHERKWAHGHLTPKNILISHDQGAVLTDIGLAYALRTNGIPLNEPAYSASEIWQGYSPSPASDQYALACILVEMLTGQPLFAGESPDEIRNKHLAGLELLPGGLPWETVPALRRALARIPGGRYPTMVEWSEALTRQAVNLAESSEEQARRSSAALAWREVQEKKRSQAEENTRLAALEQARREIEQQINQPPPAPPAGFEVDETTPASTATNSSPLLEVEDLDIPEFASGREELPQRRSRRRSTWSGWWLVLAGIILLFLVLGGLWIANRQQDNSFFPSTTTHTATIPSATFAPSATAQPTQTLTPTDTLTFTPTATQIPTATSTLTITATVSPTITLTPTQTLTFTVTRPPVTLAGTDSFSQPVPPTLTP